MPAVVRPVDASRSQSWCTDHEELLTRTADHEELQAWADQHNAEQHPNEERVTGL